MTGDEKLAATAVQLVEAKIREIRPQLIDAVTRGLCQVDRSHVTADVDEWLADGPAVVRDYASQGADAVLVGEALVKNGDPEATVRQFRTASLTKEGV